MEEQAPSHRLRVAIAEDSTLLREGLLRLFDEAGFTTVGAYGDADALVGAIDADAPDVVVMDVRMPPSFRDEGVRAAIEIRRTRPGVGVLLLSQYVETVYAQELLAQGSGGVGYLLKDRVTSLEQIQDAIERLAAGGTVLDPIVVGELLAGRQHPLGSLTARERDVLERMAAGRTNQGIASALHVGVGAVEKHVGSIFQKLGLEDSGTDHRRVLAVLAFLQQPG
ncbi:response regulator [Plantibacter sp. Mn2098]|uniref:response regulator transcription factor n=1 Tax=Plantibacter sp. Mn2098 TaxID=3395266 RepID=UPI003BCAEAC2